MIKFNVKLKIDPRKIGNNINNAVQKAQVVLDEQVLKDSNYFIPTDTTELRNSSIRSSKVGEGLIRWDTPYARRLYYNPQYNFSKDKNPNAQGLWFEEAKARHNADWEKAAQTEFDNNF